MMKIFKPSDKMVFETVMNDKRRLHVFMDELQEPKWIFDLSQVDDCDSAGIALLIEAQRLSKLTHRTCLFQGSSSAINSLIEFCGVENILG